MHFGGQELLVHPLLLGFLLMWKMQGSNIRSLHLNAGRGEYCYAQQCNVILLVRGVCILLPSLYSLNILYNKDYKPNNIHKWIFCIWAYQSIDYTFGCVHWHRAHGGVCHPPAHREFIILPSFPKSLKCRTPAHQRESEKPGASVYCRWNFQCCMYWRLIRNYGSD